MKARRKKRGINNIFRFPQVGGKKRYWTAELGEYGTGRIGYEIYDGYGMYRGVVTGKRLKNAGLWIKDKNEKTSQIYNTGFRFNMKSRKSMLNAVRLAYLKTQHWGQFK